MYQSPPDPCVIGNASAAGESPSMFWKFSCTSVACGAVRQKVMVPLELTVGPAHVVGIGPVVGVAELTTVCEVAADVIRAALLGDADACVPRVTTVAPAAPKERTT